MDITNNIACIIKASLKSYSDKEAVVYKDDALTYQALWLKVCHFSHSLISLGVQPGDRVGIYLDKKLETIIALFGCAASGAVVVPINSQLKGAQVAHIINDCQANVLITDSDRIILLKKPLSDCLSLKNVIALKHNSKDAIPTISNALSSRWEALFAQKIDSDLVTLIEKNIASITIDNDVAAIMYTSGSTGLPKGVVLSHRNMIEGAASVASYLNNTADDVLLGALPLSFDAGLSQLTTAFTVGASVVLVNYLMAKDIPPLCEKSGVTGITAVPPLWHQLAQQEWPEKAQGRLRYFANTGGKLPRTSLDKLRQIFPDAKPFLMYGLTEAFRSTYLDPAEIDNRPDSIGKAMPNTRILVCREDGTECNANEEGELVHVGATVALGYWNQPELTAQRYRKIRSQANPNIQSSCVWSGDMVTRDEQGFLYFKGRKDEMIKTSGYRVSPTEIEEIVLKSGLVSEVAAFGVDDEVLNHCIEIAYTNKENTSADEAEILKFCRVKLPRYMVPQTTHLMESLPLNSNGKYDRKKIINFTKNKEVVV